jgi:endonuclease-3
MGKLKEHFAPLSESKTITVEEMAKSNPEELASHISSLQFYNVKAKQIVLAAQEIMSRHGGIVPEDECSLLQITGIGKTFADLLAFVNTRETHRRVDS